MPRKMNGFKRGWKFRVASQSMSAVPVTGPERVMLRASETIFFPVLQYKLEMPGNFSAAVAGGSTKLCSDGSGAILHAAEAEIASSPFDGVAKAHR